MPKVASRSGLVAVLIAATSLVPASGSERPVLGGDRSDPTPTTPSETRSRPILVKEGWRAVVNFYRTTAGLPGLKERKSWSEGAELHARYMVRNREIAHSERRGRPWYTAEGDAAARNSNLSLGLDMTDGLSKRAVIERWMAAPFHAAAVLDPRLRFTGFGFHRERRDGRIAQAAVLDVNRGRTTRRGSKTVVWPGEGMQVPINTYSGNEWPDPLTSCGYTGEAGLPILALFPDDVRVRSSSLSTGSTDLEHCAFDRHTYRNPKAADRRYARALLRDRNTVVLVPRAPLQDFRTYTASIETVDGRRVTWSFSIGEVEPPYDARIVGAPASRAFQDRTSFGVSWTATDHHSGAARFDIRWRRAGLTGPMSGYVSWLNGATGSSEDFQGEPGFTYCFSARATDRAGNMSRWGKETCTTMPVRSIDLADQPMWLPLYGPDFYAGRAALSRGDGSRLRSQVVKASRLALVATVHPGAGVVEVLWNDEVLGRVDLSSNGMRSRMQVEFEPFGRVRTGRVTVRVVSGAYAIVEGIGVARR